MTLDESLAAFEHKEAALKAVLQELNTAQAAGQIGLLEAYQRAKALNEELTALGATLAAKLDQTLASL